MQEEEIDRIIEEALKKDGRDGRRKHHRPGKDKTQQVRKILNILFLIGCAVTLFVYFQYPDNKLLFFSVGFGSILLKVVEFFIRFLL